MSSFSSRMPHGLKVEDRSEYCRNVIYPDFEVKLAGGRVAKYHSFVLRLFSPIVAGLVDSGTMELRVDQFEPKTVATVLGFAYDTPMHHSPMFVDMAYFRELADVLRFFGMPMPKTVRIDDVYTPWLVEKEHQPKMRKKTGKPRNRTKNASWRAKKHARQRTRMDDEAVWEKKRDEEDKRYHERELQCMHDVYMAIQYPEIDLSWRFTVSAAGPATRWEMPRADIDRICAHFGLDATRIKSVKLGYVTVENEWDRYPDVRPMGWVNDGKRFQMRYELTSRGASCGWDYVFNEMLRVCLDLPDGCYCC